MRRHLRQILDTLLIQMASNNANIHILHVVRRGMCPVQRMANFSINFDPLKAVIVVSIVWYLVIIFAIDIDLTCEYSRSLVCHFALSYDFFLCFLFDFLHALILG